MQNLKNTSWTGMRKNYVLKVNQMESMTQTTMADKTTEIIKYMENKVQKLELNEDMIKLEAYPTHNEILGAENI